jgi:hypothetical protein
VNITAISANGILTLEAAQNFANNISTDRRADNSKSNTHPQEWS